VAVPVWAVEPLLVDDSPRKAARGQANSPGFRADWVASHQLVLLLTLTK